MPGFLMLTWVLHPLRYTRIQALSPAMGAALYVLHLTSRIPAPTLPSAQGLSGLGYALWWRWRTALHPPLFPTSNVYKMRL